MSFETIFFLIESKFNNQLECPSTPNWTTNNNK